MTNGAHHGDAGGSSQKPIDSRGKPNTVAKPQPKKTPPDAGDKK